MKRIIESFLHSGLVREQFINLFFLDKYEREAAKNWNKFYKHNTVNFFKDRQYFAHEFPEVGDTIIRAENEGRQCHLVELGCGVGNTLLPLLRAHPTLVASGFDYAENAVRFLFERYAKEAEALSKLSTAEFDNLRKFGTLTEPHTEEEMAAVTAAEQEGDEDGPQEDIETCNSLPGKKTENSKRCRYVGPPNLEDVPFEGPVPNLSTPQLIPQVETNRIGKLFKLMVLDASKNVIPADLCEEGTADFAVLMFVLSAIQPDDYAFVAREAARILRPGGILYIRDYARYDMAQLRLAQQTRPSKLSENFYVRGDETRVYYFSEEEMFNIFGPNGAGLNVIENKIFTRQIVNRKRELTMHRIWIQSKFIKP